MISATACVRPSLLFRTDGSTRERSSKKSQSRKAIMPYLGIAEPIFHGGKSERLVARIDDIVIEWPGPQCDGDRACQPIESRSSRQSTVSSLVIARLASETSAGFWTSGRSPPEFRGREKTPEFLVADGRCPKASVARLVEKRQLSELNRFQAQPDWEMSSRSVWPESLVLVHCRRRTVWANPHGDGEVQGFNTRGETDRGSRREKGYSALIVSQFHAY